ncbi:MAG: VOC family protein [Planctomycetota bacterium]
MSEIEKFLAVRVVCATPEKFEEAVRFYRGLLGRDEGLRFGQPGDVQQGAFFSLGDAQLIVTCEEVTPEAAVEQGAAWLCFHSQDPEQLLADARGRGAALPNDVVDTSFGTRGFFANEPTGLPIYVGTPWSAGV